MLEVGQLEDLGWDGGEAVAVEPESLQTAGQVGKTACLQWWDTIVVEKPEPKRFKREVSFKYKDTEETLHYNFTVKWLNNC